MNGKSVRKLFVWMYPESIIPDYQVSLREYTTDTYLKIEY